MKTKRLATKKEHSTLGKQLLWFVGIYFVSILTLWLFHEFSKYLIAYLK